MVTAPKVKKKTKQTRHPPQNHKQMNKPPRRNNNIFPKVILYKNSRFKKKLTFLFLNEISMQNQINGLQFHQTVMLVNISTDT